jgi:AcrR family transcriptional regulator
MTERDPQDDAKGRAARSAGLPRLPSTQADLSPTARKLLEAARRVLEQNGFKGLSYESVGREAGLSPNLIRYHFGSKAGLLIALTDWLFYDALWDLWRSIPEAKAAKEGSRLVMRDALRLVSSPNSYELYYDLLPHLLENPRTRKQLEELYGTYVSVVASAFTSNGTVDGEADKTIAALAALTVAAGDGLGVQLTVRPESVDLERVWSLWGDFVEWTLRRVEQDTGSVSSSDPPD